MLREVPIAERDPGDIGQRVIAQRETAAEIDAGPKAEVLPVDRCREAAAANSDSTR